jgi:hypothetical protein
MCHITFLSTTAPDDFQGVDDDHFRLERVADDEGEEAARSLAFPHRWYVECRFGGCSCHFRNWLEENPPEFGAPEDWFEEDPEDVEATRAFYDFVAGLVAAGHEVDIVTVWTGSVPRHTWDVSLSEVSREAFRFMDGFRFLIRD